MEDVITFFTALLLFTSIVLAMKKAPRILNESFLLATVSGSIHSIYHHLSRISDSPRRLLPGELPPYDGISVAAATTCVWLLVSGAYPCMAVLSRLGGATSVPESHPVSAWHLCTRLRAASFVCWCRHCLDTRLPALPACDGAAGQNGGQESKGCNADLNSMFKIKFIGTCLPLSALCRRHSQGQRGAT